MLYIKKEVTEEQLLKHGFKKCKRPYNHCYYLCVSRGCKIIFIGHGIYVFDWEEKDPRIHKNPNCRYKSYKTYEYVLYNLITEGLIESKIF